MPKFSVCFTPQAAVSMSAGGSRETPLPSAAVSSALTLTNQDAAASVKQEPATNERRASPQCRTASGLTNEKTDIGHVMSNPDSFTKGGQN